MDATPTVGEVFIGVLGVTLVIIWVNERFNRPALYWGVAQLGLLLASLFGRFFERLGIGALGALALWFSATFLAGLYCANHELRGRRASVRLFLAVALGAAVIVGIAGFGLPGLPLPKVVGRLVFDVLLLGLYLWSAVIFLTSLRAPAVGLGFLCVVAAYLAAMTDLERFGTSQTTGQAQWAIGAAHLLVGLLLISTSMSQSRRRLNLILENLKQGVAALSQTGEVIFCNDTFGQILGLGRLAVTGAEVERFIGVAQSGEAATPPAQGVSEVTTFERELSSAHRGEFPAEIAVRRFDEMGKTVTLVEIFDLTEVRRAEEERLRRATTDEITGLANRNLLEQLLTNTLWEGVQQGSQCAVLVIDLQQFRRVNDALGRSAGDGILREIAAELEACRRPGQFLGRIGGDEFALVIPVLPTDYPLAVIDDIAADIHTRVAQRLTRIELSIPLHLAIGVAVSSAADTASQLLAHAETAMNESKSGPIPRTCYFSADLAQRRFDFVRLQSALALATDRGEMSLHYQPIFSGDSARCGRVEALARWRTSDGDISPATFIPLAEQTGQIVALGDWLLKEAVRQAASWYREFGERAPVMCINISARQLAHPGFEPRLFELIARAALEPRQFELELTETVLFEPNHPQRALLKRLRQSGFGLSIDDFGTGYSSLAYLSRFKVSTLKIDRSFVSGLGADPASEAIVRSIITLAHGLGVAVVAEGVETVGQANILASAQCDYLQGYLVGRPVHPDRLRSDYLLANQGASGAALTP